MVLSYIILIVCILLKKGGARGRICDKFDGCSSENTKAKIAADFTKPDGFIRIVFATVAFGMGLDSPNIRKIIHCPPLLTDIELYVQKTGRAGRDKQKVHYILYYQKKDLFSNMQDTMKYYCGNGSKCRSQVLMSEFIPSL